ncbi:MAG TPA: pyridoxamine 5'-phosphate oxidase family protein, partial [Asanoa sp.]|nr:pyridoxamine 5'-phosphate oxidase family protein [Asanoa sp.]
MDGPVGVGSVVGSVGERILQEAYGTQERARRFYDTQVLDHLSETMRAFIGRQEMMFVSTADADGRCDST